MRLRNLLFIVLLPALAPAASADGAPPLFSAHYGVYADGFKVGEMERHLRALDADTYTLETKAVTTGLVAIFKQDEYIERSTWKSGKESYLPVEFYSRYRGRSKEVVERLRFDWERNVVLSLRDGKETELPVESGVLDKLMYQVVMRDELERGVTRLKYRVADRGKIEDYELEVVGREVIDTVLGKQPTVKVRKGTTLLWCATELDYLPVKLEQRDDGHTLASHLVSLTRGPTPSMTRR